MLPTVLASLAIVAGVLVTLLALVMLVACAPNSSPKQWALLRTLMISVVAVGVVGVAGGIWAIVAGRVGLGGGLGLAPLPYSVVMFIILYAAEA